MSAISGKDGKVNIASSPAADVLEWDMTKSVTTSRFASSASGGVKRTIAGVKSASGSIKFTFDSAAAATLLEGVSASLKLYDNATLFYLVPAILKDFRISIDINDGKYVEVSCNYESDGAYTEPTYS